MFIYYNMNEFIKKLMETEHFNDYTLDITTTNILNQLRNEIKHNYDSIQERNLKINKLNETINIEKNQQYFHDTIIDDINKNQNNGISVNYKHSSYLFKFSIYKLKNNFVSNKKY